MMLEYLNHYPPQGLECCRMQAEINKQLMYTRNQHVTRSAPLQYYKTLINYLWDLMLGPICNI